MVLVILVVLIAGVAIIGGGNTLSGFGHDVQNSGEKIQKISE